MEIYQILISYKKINKKFPIARLIEILYICFCNFFLFNLRLERPLVLYQEKPRSSSTRYVDVDYARYNTGRYGE